MVCDKAPLLEFYTILASLLSSFFRQCRLMEHIDGASPMLAPQLTKHIDIMLSDTVCLYIHIVIDFAEAA